MLKEYHTNGETLYPTHMTNGITSILQMITMAKINRLYGVGLSVAGDGIGDFSFLLYLFPRRHNGKN